MAEGAALEMPCTGNCTVGSNPTPSANPFRTPDVDRHNHETRSVEQTSVEQATNRETRSVEESLAIPMQPETPPSVEKGPAARRRAKAGREAYSLYVERPDERANEADGPLSALGVTGPC